MEVGVLGPLEVVADGGEVVALVGRQRRLFAALLVAAGEVCPADALIEAVWDRSPPGSAGKVLQVYVSRLRKALPEAIRIRTDESGYALELDRERLDSARFERLLDEAKASAEDGNPALALSLLERALSLWRGKAYGELAYDDFARAEAERLEELRLLALEEQLEAALQLGRHTRLLPQLHALAAAHPLRERLSGQLMLALYRSGRQTEALASYTSIRTRLRDELGLEPDARLRELQRRILEHDPELAVASTEETSPSALPSPPNRLLGRERELDELRKLLLHDEIRLLVLTGAGGSGKTRLALEAARRNTHLFANGAVLVELAPQPDPDLVAGRISAALGVREGSGETLETLVAALRPLELLLVVDNAEHLHAAAPLYVELLARAPRLTLLVTSRTVLHLTGERVYPVEPLPEEAAFALFVERAREAEPRFRPDQNDEHAIRRICERLDRLPLAIELAAGRTRTLTPAELIDRLEPRLPLLTGGPHDLPARQQTLRATIEWSYDLLDEPERRDLACLSVFTGGFTLEAVEAVGETTVDRLATLVDHNLIQRTGTGDGSRYTMLETIREYALERLGDSADAEDVHRRHASHFLELAERGDLWDWPEPLVADRLQREQDNFNTALAWFRTTGEEEAELQLLAALGWFWKQGHLQEGRRWLDEAVPRAERHQPLLRVRLLNVAAGVLGRQGDLAGAASLEERCLALHREAGDSKRAALSLMYLGALARQEGQFARAKELLEEGRKLCEEVGEWRTFAGIGINLGVLAQATGDLEGAKGLYEESLGLFEDLQHNYGRRVALLSLGDVALEQNRLDEAETLVEESLRVVALRTWFPEPLELLAAVAARRGDSARAIRLWAAAAAAREQMGAALPATEQPLHERIALEARARLGDQRFEELQAEGAAMTPEQAIEFALAT